jgi:NAD(P)-dependent dehydrogenase (short-subunit alcohol dehydrogenase family)
MDLTNASAIVTGGGGGFGAATVGRLAQKGAKGVIADVSDERGQSLAREVGASRTATIERCRSIMFLGMPEGGCLGWFPTHIGAVRLAEGPRGTDRESHA